MSEEEDQNNPYAYAFNDQGFLSLESMLENLVK